MSSTEAVVPAVYFGKPLMANPPLWLLGKKKKKKDTRVNVMCYSFG